MTSLYRQILKKSWHITKRFKYLWPLGLFAAFLGNGGEYQILFNQSQNVAQQTSIIEAWTNNLNALMPNLNFSAHNVFFLILNLLVAAIIFLFFLWLTISAFGGLIKGANNADKDERSSFSQLLKEGGVRFFPLLGVNVVAKAIVYGIIVLIITPLMLATFAQHNDTLNLLIILITFIIFIPLVIIVSLATKYASAYIMLEKEKCWPAFKKGWKLFFQNWLISLEMAFIVFIINIVVSLVFVLISLIIFSPFFFFGIIYTIQFPALFNVLIYIAIALLLVASAIVGSLLATFQISSWTLLFNKLNGNSKTYSKIVRWVAGFPDKMKKKEA